MSKINENINLCEILKGHEGETFYSPCFGLLVLEAIGNDSIKFSSISQDFDNVYIYFSPNGKYAEEGEYMIFPSKDHRDWVKWDKENNKVPKTWSELYKKEMADSYDLGKNGEFHISNERFNSNEYLDDVTPIEKSALALLKIHQLIEVGYGGNVLCNKKGHWDGGIHGYTISFRPSSKSYLDGYEIIPIERSNSVVSPIMFKTREYAEEFLKYEENCSLFRIFNLVAYPRDIK